MLAQALTLSNKNAKRAKILYFLRLLLIIYAVCKTEVSVKILKLTLFVFLCIFVAACGQSHENPLSEWYENANLNEDISPQELYELALTEDTLVIYTTTTRIYDVKESFESQYPGLTVEIYDTRAHDLVDILLNNYETRNFNCDIVICSDDTGILSIEYFPLYIVNKYVPSDIKPHLFSYADTELLSFVAETQQLFYNPNIYSECPITNWWQLTEPAWKGKVYMNSPLRSHPAFALFYAVIQNSDLMQEAYYDLYGEELIIPENSSAGEIFWQMMIENDMQFTTSSNELIEIVGDDSNQDGPLAFMISSKIRRSEIGLNVAVAYGALPTDGVVTTNTISIAGGAKNINAAKLFIWHLMGEGDGTGEGLQPYIKEGTWPVRTDIEDYSSAPLNDGNFWYNDKITVFQMEEDVIEFWTQLQNSQR